MADIYPNKYETKKIFDPRMPHYKRRILENVFAGSLPQVVELKTFGYALEQESFASDYDGHPIDT